ncbi:hypothetical protein AN641_08600 [Candidatus Epulonipiscioides gigas]|nr:hypothetical protein AN641_08600 [Epulopiscium sp. SCG-C07WGA-EpuloA2]
MTTNPVGQNQNSIVHTTKSDKVTTPPKQKVAPKNTVIIEQVQKDDLKKQIEKIKEQIEECKNNKDLDKLFKLQMILKSLEKQEETSDALYDKLSAAIQ